MGDDLPAVDLGTGRTAISVAAGLSHSCALLDDHTVKCWGRGRRGSSAKATPPTAATAQESSATPFAAIDLGTGRTATAIAAGAQHTCALLDDGSVKCWGQNNLGQLGQGHGSFVGDAVW